MKLCTYTAQDQTRTGIVVGDSVIGGRRALR